MRRIEVKGDRYFAPEGAARNINAAVGTMTAVLAHTRAALAFAEKSATRVPDKDLLTKIEKAVASLKIAASPPAE